MKLIDKLELEFGTDIWKPLDKNDYVPTKQDYNTLFNAFNEHVFEGRLQPAPVLFKHSPVPGAIAGFQFGNVRGVPVCMNVYDTAYTSLFMFMNVVAHEMIHYYDWTRGPLSKMYEFFSSIQVEMGAFSPSRRHPTQVTYSPQYKSWLHAVAAGSKVYDCHGDWFHRQAEKFNAQGFDVRDIFDPAAAQKQLRRVDEDPDETPAALRHLNSDGWARAMFDAVENSCHKSFVFKDKDNWFIEIS